MVIYNPEKKVLFIPEKDDYILFDPDEVYERGYAQGYEKGRAKAEEECEEKA